VRISLSVVAMVSDILDSDLLVLADPPLDSKVYIWHKENGSLVESLDGHSKGCVNSISWNPADPTMFASAGDDRAVRMYVCIFFSFQ
jgi:WD40 repeat protein